MIALGIDPGFAFVGFGVVQLTNTSSRVLHHETFKTTTKVSDELRMDAIADRVGDVIERFNPDAIGYENQSGVEVAMQREGEGTNVSSRRVHEVCGIIRCAARYYELPCYCLAISTIKVAVLGKGGGRAKKPQVKAAVRMIFGVAGCSEHAADGIAISVATTRAHRAHLLSLRRSSAFIH
jgi:crossover junction endodeoxyribonuclease RuvC